MKTQYGAVPYRVIDGVPVVMLITSRETRRWLIPKGWPEPDLKPAEVAAREMYEEAGLIGHAQREPVGVFHYGKRLSSGRVVPCRVRTFLFDVDQELTEWPEKDQRERRWVAPLEAAEMVEETELASILRGLTVLPPKTKARAAK